MHIRPALALCTPILVCFAAVAQEVGPPAPVGPEPSVGEQPVETVLEISNEPVLELQQLPASAEALPAPDAAETTLPGIGNDDVLDMVGAQFGETTIVAAIEANETRFDVSPKALMALKGAGVSERVIEAMLAAEAAKKQAAAMARAAAPAPAPVQVAPAETAVALTAQTPVQMTPEALAALSQVVERLAIQSAALEPEPADADPDPWEIEGQVPRAWVADSENKSALAPTIAQVALTDTKRIGGTAFKTLRSFAGKALAFANPAFGLASGFGELFRSNDPTMTAVWALLGASASRELSTGAAFEVEFGNIPGVNPDEYRPAIVQLVPTSDNYRLVGAAKTNGSDPGGVPSGPIMEEPVAAQLTQLARGRYRVALNALVPPGEYALVLRPIVTRERERRRNSEDSLGELMGGGASQILYMTWDFTIKS